MGIEGGYLKGSSMSSGSVSRRGFIKTTAAVSAVAMTALGSNFAYAAGSDKIRVGVVGCGGRARGAARDCVTAAGNVQIVALADLFKDRLDEARQNLADLG